MAAAKMSGEALFAFLDAHPNLRDRIASIVGAIEDSDGNLKEADAAKSGSSRKCFWDGRLCRGVGPTSRSN